jgi:hypothetical protein
MKGIHQNLVPAERLVGSKGVIGRGDRSVGTFGVNHTSYKHMSRCVPLECGLGHRFVSYQPDVPLGHGYLDFYCLKSCI